MTHEVLESISQRINGTEVEKNCRIYEIANELSRRCRICKCELREGEKHASEIDIERIVTERYAKEIDCWIPMAQMFGLGTPGPSGNENDTYISEKYIYKVNNLLNSKGSILQHFIKVLLHNSLFEDTSYTFLGFTGFSSSTIMPVFKQPLIKNAVPATSIEISTYMAALGFNGAGKEGSFTNGEIDVWDVVSRNVLKDIDGDIFVIDAELRLRH